MKLKLLIFPFILLLLLAGCSDTTKSLYVATNGNDLADGSIHAPYQTIERAQQEVRKIIAQKETKQIRVYLREGDYYLSNTIQFDESDSGEHTTVTYTAYDAEHVSLYGGIPVTGWEKWNETIYRAKLPESLQGQKYNVLIEDEGEAMPQARYPNNGSGFGQGLNRKSNTSIEVPSSWGEYDFSEAQVYGWIGSNWFSELRSVESFDKKTLQLSVDRGSNAFGGLNGRLYIQGVPELLDAEGEWYQKDNYIYYWPIGKEKEIQDRKIILPVLSRVLDIRGRTEENRIRGLSFEHLCLVGSNFASSWRIFEEGKDGSMPEELQEGLVYIENAKNIQFRHCEIIGAGHSAIYINNSSEQCVVEGCHIKEAGFCGIYANSYFPGTGGFDNVQDSYVNKKHVFTNNYIHDCGKYIGGGCGIQLFQSGDNMITHNVIHEMPRYGISYKGVRNQVLMETLPDQEINYANHFDYIHTRNNYIAYNEIYNVCRSSFDFGAIESWGAGRDNVWEHNAIHDIDQSVEWDGWAHGLFPDDASDFLTVRNNIVYELKGGRATGAIMVKSFNQVVENNIFADNEIGRALTMSPYAEPAGNNCVRRNIIYHSGQMLYDVDQNSFSTDFYGFYENDFNKQYVKGISVFNEVDKNVIYPGYDQLDSLKQKGWDTQSLIADPLFDKKNPSHDVTYMDYKFKENTPAGTVLFQPIDYEKIGLLPDYSFERKKNRRASSLMEAESYTRMKGLRPVAATGIHHMEQGAWSKYENIDFKEGVFTQCVIKQIQSDTNTEQPGCLFELRIDSPDGTLIGQVNKGDEIVPVKMVTGVHNLYVVFHQDVFLDAFRFLPRSF